jgi:hypothetical protein
MAPKTNDFQHGIEEVRDRVASLIGERLTGDKDDMFTGHWAGPQRVSGVIKYVLNDDYFVAGVQFDGEGVSKLTSASFMLSTTTWNWNHAVVRDDDVAIPNGIKHGRSMDRAYSLMIKIATRVGPCNLKGKYIFILDGNGENRRAMENALNDLSTSLYQSVTVRQ